MFTTGERLAPRRGFSPRWTFFTTLVVGLLAVSLWLRYSAAPVPGPPPVPPPVNSIAVLPLVNASPDTANDYLSDGITGELIAALGTVPGLRVIGPSSSLAFKRSQLEGRQIGRRLGVGAVLEGSIRPAGDLIRVNANLVSVAQGFDLWTETYEVELTDLPSVQQDLTRSVVRALRLRLPAGAALPAHPGTRLDAYREYLAGRALSARPTEETVPAAIAALENAVGLDSAFAPAWAALAEARTREMALDLRPTRDAAPLAREAAERALAFDSTLAGAHTALGLVLFLRDWEWGAAERAFQRAIALNPNLPDPQHWYSHLLTALGRGEESLAASRRALELSPADPAMSAHLGWHHLMAGESRQADEALARAVALDPASPDAHFHLALLSAARGDYGSAEEHLARVPLPAATAPRIRAELGRVYALAGRTDEARGIRDELREAAISGYVPAYEMALVTLALGETGRAMALLESSAADRDESVVYLRVDPRWERLRDDRRFARVVRRLGLP
jgi:serine/threonine-protein kinase